MDLNALKIDRPHRATSSKSGPKAAPTPPRSGGGRRKRSPWFGRFLFLAVVAGLIWLFRSPLLRQVDRFTLPSVEVVEAQVPSRGAAGAVKGTAANGYIIAARRAALSADTPGRIVELNVTEGSLVAKGDIVARLFSDEYAAALERAQAETQVATAEVQGSQARLEVAKVDRRRRERELSSAAALLNEARAQQKLAEEDYARAKSLVDQGISSPSLLDQATADRDRAAARTSSTEALSEAAAVGIAQADAEIARADADVTTAQARIASAEAAVNQAAATLDKTIVRAPFDGIVVLKDAEVGEVVSPNSQGGSNARGSICTMVDRDSLEVQVDLPESSLEDITVGAPAQVFLDAYPGDSYAGRVDRIWPTANRQKATVEIRVTLDPQSDTPDGAERRARLRPDMGLRVVFQKATAPPPATGPGGTAEIDSAVESGDAFTNPDDIVLVPTSALVDADGNRAVFTVEQDTVRLVAVTIAETKGASAAITSGLRPGQRIVANPPPTLRDGDRVVIQNP